MRCALMQILCRGSRDWTHCPCPAMQLLMQSSRQWTNMNKYDKQLGGHATIDRHQGRNRIPGEPQNTSVYIYIYLLPQWFSSLKSCQWLQYPQCLVKVGRPESTRCGVAGLGSPPLQHQISGNQQKSADLWKLCRPWVWCEMTDLVSAMHSELC